MKLKLVCCCLMMVFILRETICQKQFESKNTLEGFDYISAFKDTLLHLSEISDNELFKISCKSIISVIEGKNSLTKQDSVLLKDTYDAFNNNADTSNPKKLSSYMKRLRPFILSWVSPTDSTVSFSYMRPPKNWDPEISYPLYINLHGLADYAINPIEYMTAPYLDVAADDSLWDNGFTLRPWGRGNLWYKGIAETDIWEAIASLEKIVNVDRSRKYLSGFSMGGSGVWHIANRSPNTWAAIGVVAGALDVNEVNSSIAQKLKDVPSYFLCGNADGLLGINQSAYNLLLAAGNSNIDFVTFDGGHDYNFPEAEKMYLWMRQFVNEDWNTAIDNDELTAQPEFSLNCYPNPVTSKAYISFKIFEKSKINLSVYDIYGRFIDLIVNDEKVPGKYEIDFDASGLTNGIYLIRLRTGNFLVDSKMVVVR